MKLLWAVLAVLVALSAAKKKSKVEDVEKVVTDIATITIEVKDYNDEGDTLTGDIKIGLFGELAPMTVLNFGKICDGFKNQNSPKLQYKNSNCHRLVKDMLVQCGDVTKFDGSGSQSIFGGKFIDESFKVSHASKGIVSMANHGKDTNGSQFFILFGRARYLDEHHVAFGKVLEGIDLLEEINEMGPEDQYATPKHKIRISECVAEKLTEPYVMHKKVFLADDPTQLKL